MSDTPIFPEAMASVLALPGLIAYGPTVLHRAALRDDHNGVVTLANWRTLAGRPKTFWRSGDNADTYVDNTLNPGLPMIVDDGANTWELGLQRADGDAIAPLDIDLADAEGVSIAMRVRFETNANPSRVLGLGQVDRSNPSSPVTLAEGRVGTRGQTNNEVYGGLSGSSADYITVNPDLSFPADVVIVYSQCFTDRSQALMVNTYDMTQVGDPNVASSVSHAAVQAGYEASKFPSRLTDVSLLASVDGAGTAAKQAVAWPLVFLHPLHTDQRKAECKTAVQALAALGSSPVTLVGG